MSQPRIKWATFVQAALKEFNTMGQVSAPLRWYFYRLVTHYGLPHTNYHYKKLSDRLARAREVGTIPWTAMLDEEREAIGGQPWYWAIHRNINYEINALLGMKPDSNLRYFQREYLEVWCEKKTLTSHLAKAIMNLDVVYVPSHGYTSVTFMKTSQERLQKAWDDLGKPIHILYAGDWDPSGVGPGSIEANIQKKLKAYGAPPFTWERVTLLPAQITQYQLPMKLVKQQDPRTPKFVQQHGVNTAELDALHPTVILNLLLGAIAQHTDTTIEARRQAWYAAEYAYMKQELPRKLRVKLKRL